MADKAHSSVIIAGATFIEGPDSLVCGHVEISGNSADLLKMPHADQLFWVEEELGFDLEPSHWSTLLVCHPIGPSCG